MFPLTSSLPHIPPHTSHLQNLNVRLSIYTTTLLYVADRYSREVGTPLRRHGTAYRESKQRSREEGLVTSTEQHCCDGGVITQEGTSRITHAVRQGR